MDPITMALIGNAIAGGVSSIWGANKQAAAQKKAARESAMNFLKQLELQEKALKEAKESRRNTEARYNNALGTLEKDLDVLEPKWKAERENLLNEQAANRRTPSGTSVRQSTTKAKDFLLDMLMRDLKKSRNSEHELIIPERENNALKESSKQLDSLYKNFRL
jgi:hypothetical protein